MIARYTRPRSAPSGPTRRASPRCATWRSPPPRRSTVRPPEELDAIRAATFTVDAINEREKILDHDTAAFVDVLAASAGPAGRWIHYGLTSSDVVDTGLALQLQRAGALLVPAPATLAWELAEKAREHADTLCVGRTHGVHAEPTSFGLKLAGYAMEAHRNADRLERAFGADRPARSPAPSAPSPRSAPTTRQRVLSELGLAPRARLDPGRPARPPRGAAERDRPRRRRARALRDRDPPPAAHRGARGRGAVPQGPEGLERDAAQAQPGRLRAHLRPRAGPARQRAGRRWRTSRSGTSATSRTPAPSGSCCPTPRSCSTRCSRSRCASCAA